MDALRVLAGSRKLICRVGPSASSECKALDQSELSGSGFQKFAPFSRDQALSANTVILCHHHAGERGGDLGQVISGPFGLGFSRPNGESAGLLKDTEGWLRTFRITPRPSMSQNLSSPEKSTDHHQHTCVTLLLFLGRAPNTSWHILV